MSDNSSDGSSGFYGGDDGMGETASGDHIFVPDIRYGPEVNEPASVLAIIMLMGMGIPLVCLVLLSGIRLFTAYLSFPLRVCLQWTGKAHLLAVPVFTQ
mmetsp:Transcript_7129/g.13992  ORF Transcript_7129/g.13992 Transcript_7129/m.13992 type:complete len:99 (-) Transcript_7129:1135-1431(-)|eukprot:657975-Pleurochrysis_carterae.AAC.7